MGGERGRDRWQGRIENVNKKKNNEKNKLTRTVESQSEGSKPRRNYGAESVWECLGVEKENRQLVLHHTLGNPFERVPKEKKKNNIFPRLNDSHTTFHYLFVTITKPFSSIVVFTFVAPRKKKKIKQ